MRPATRSKPVRSLEEINPDRPDKRIMVGVVHEKCLAAFRALMREALQ